LGKNKKKSAPGTPASLLGQLAAKPDKLFSGAFRAQIGALCYRYAQGGSMLEILLVTSRDTGRWVIPKGWPMKGKKPHEAATIEAWEEAGVRGRTHKTAVGRYTYLKSLDDGDVAPCIVEVFAIEVSKVSDKFKERGERQIAWVSASEAARRVREIELKSMMIEFKPNEVR
jgi:8-oxo-dGTP pyrophosphatase MutT (NUDIX family)